MITTWGKGAITYILGAMAKPAAAPTESNVQTACPLDCPDACTLSVTVRGGRIDTPIGRFAAPGLEEGGSAVLCIRQRGIRVSTSGQGLAGRVLRVKFLGDVGQIEIGVQGFDMPLKARARESLGWSPGAEVSVEIDPARVLVFPTEELKMD